MIEKVSPLQLVFHVIQVGSLCRHVVSDASIPHALGRCCTAARERPLPSLQDQLLVLGWCCAPSQQGNTE